MEIIERKETKSKTKAVTAAADATGEQGTLTRTKTRVGGAVKTLFTKKRKFLILGTMFVLLCVTGYLNFALNSNNTLRTGGGHQIESDLFTMFRNTRADERTRDIMIYENLIATSANAETVASAEARLLEIRGNVAFETAAEGLILAEQYDNVLVNKSNGFVNVLIKRDSNIDRIQAIKIMSILQSVKPGLDIDNVFISIME